MIVAEKPPLFSLIDLDLTAPIYISVRGRVPSEHDEVRSIYACASNLTSKKNHLGINLEEGKLVLEKKRFITKKYFFIFPRLNNFKLCSFMQSDCIEKCFNLYSAAISAIKMRASISEPCLGILAGKDNYLIRCEVFADEFEGKSQVLYTEPDDFF